MLADAGRGDYAFQLAEHSFDFRSLSELSNDPLIGGEARIRQYLDRYGAAFANELYQWYLEKGPLVAIVSC